MKPLTNIVLYALFFSVFPIPGPSPSSIDQPDKVWDGPQLSYHHLYQDGGRKETGPEHCSQCMDELCGSLFTCCDSFCP